MQPEQRDKALLWDIKEAAQDILEFVEGITSQDFEANKVVRYAVERQILIIGEAANRISDSFKEKKISNPMVGNNRPKKHYRPQIR